jgi:hypothetical protein
MSKLDIPVYIISLKNNSYFDFNKHFNNVTFYNAIDARNKKPLDYYNQGIISARVYYDLENGRKNHWGFAGIGGIGLYLTIRKLFQELVDKNINENVLICEDDCKIDDLKEFIRKINLLNNANFDCAIFGSKFFIPPTKETHESLNNQIQNSNDILNINKSLSNNLLDNDFYKCKQNFYLYHSSVWSPNGIKKMNEFLKQIIELQIDNFISFLGINNKLDVRLEKNSTTSQSHHVSSLQNDKHCLLCDINGNDEKYNKSYFTIIKEIILISFVCILILIIFRYYLYKNK